MDFGSISHRSAFTDCYALNADEIIVNLRTGKDVTAVMLIHEDPYAGNCTGFMPWGGTPEAMSPQWELKHSTIWSIRLRPKFKREQYYFCITGGNDPDNRRPMPWDKIHAGTFNTDLKETAALISLRNTYPQLRRGQILWEHSDETPRLIRYGRYIKGDSRLLAVYLNAGSKPVILPEEGSLLFSRNRNGNRILPGGVAIVLTEVAKWNG